MHFQANAFQRHLKYELLGIPVPTSQKKFKPGAVPTLYYASHVSTAGGEQIVISDASQPTHTRSSNSRASHVSTAGGEQIVISDASQPTYTRSSNSRASHVSTAGGEQIVISEPWLPIHNIFDAKEHPEDSSRRDPTHEEEGIILRKRKFLDTCEMTHTVFLHDTIHALKQQLAVVRMERDKLLIENRKYQELIILLQGNIKSDSATVTSDIKEKLRAHFSDSQIKSLFEGKRNVAKWSHEDLSQAVNLRSLSTNAYCYLRNKNIIPLPSIATINRWVGKLNVEPGPLTSIVHVLRHKADIMSEFERLCVLSFDETSVSQEWSYDKATDTVYAP
ncbi:uncharacterized protein LOC143040232 isoform X2 [Oratosquilla oratoria]|uniref:uncharacterized protein LOC143040232 isoform X2 n=1 Tax=Oratosquilla oratoria TaxID=337810 RepID=UPI003F767341